MAELTRRAPPRPNFSTAIFTIAIFTSAALVFLVEPMVAKMLLPRLGGSPAVWNASIAFFQTALLLGYVYAHVLQRLPSVKTQAAVHLICLGLAGATLPLALTRLLGEPSPNSPILWLLGVLVLSVGAPFAILSSTTPLISSWFARLSDGRPEGENPYVLYVASNAGSLLALLAYPALIEPTLRVGQQTQLWTLGYGVFGALIAGLAFLIFRAHLTPPIEIRRDSLARDVVTWRARSGWVLLAAAPSSLLLGVTTFISTDVAAAPLFWVLPLALYLLTFVVAFQARPAIQPRAALLGQAVLVPIALLVMPFNFLNWWVVVALHAIAFFSTAMVCHQKLAGGRPRPEHLTEFYLCVAAGGVIGGAATAFLAPVVFKTILEYPLVLVLAGLARPTLAARPRPVDWIVLAASLICATVLAVLYRQGPMSLGTVLALLTVGAIAAIVVKRHRLLFVAAVALLALQVTLGLESKATLYSARTFFGVHRVAYAEVPELGGAVHLLVNGNTLHGAQALVPAFECRQTNYYVREGAIGQVYTDMQARHARMRMGVVGLGGGTIAAYVRKGDSLRFFEIDPEVERIARDRRYFTYLSDCPKGPVDVVLGDARLTLGHEAPASYDLIHLDAFTSAAIPTHLLTVEAIEQYLRLLKPDGVLLLHISNRHLALEGPVAAAKRLGVLARVQNYRTARGVPLYVAESSDVMVVTRSPEAMAVFANDSRWRVPRTGRSRAWTDDYTNVLGAMIAKSLE